MSDTSHWLSTVLNRTKQNQSGGAVNKQQMSNIGQRKRVVSYKIERWFVDSISFPAHLFVVADRKTINIVWGDNSTIVMMWTYIVDKGVEDVLNVW